MREAALTKLLLSLFTADELRMHLALHRASEDIQASLPEKGVPNANLAFAAVDVLKRRGLIDDEFFQGLEAARPNRIDDIRVVRTMWFDGSSGAVSSPVALAPQTAGKRMRKVFVYTLCAATLSAATAVYLVFRVLPRSEPATVSGEVAESMASGRPFGSGTAPEPRQMKDIRPQEGFLDEGKSAEEPSSERMTDNDHTPSGCGASIRSGFHDIHAYTSSQRVPKWGWAAGLASILRYHKLSVTQEELIEHAGAHMDENAFAGEYPDFHLTLDLISLSPAAILDEINSDNPFLILIQGRVYVFKTMIYQVCKDGSAKVHQIVIADTMPNTVAVRALSQEEVGVATMVRVRVRVRVVPQ